MTIRIPKSVDAAIGRITRHPVAAAAAVAAAVVGAAALWSQTVSVTIAVAALASAFTALPLAVVISGLRRTDAALRDELERTRGRITHQDTAAASLPTTEIRSIPEWGERDA